MENYMTIDEAIVLYDESIFEETGNAFEDFDEFPTKNHRNVARRKRAFFKSKHRFGVLHSHGLDPLPEWKPTICGILRKTNVLIHSYSTPYATSISNIRRLSSANDKLSGYFMED